MIDEAKVVAWKVEENPGKGTFWFEVWSVLGRMDGDQFIQYVDPNTGQVAIYRKIENGRNPLGEQLLGRCSHPSCRAWTPGQISGDCPVCHRVGSVEPYDGYTRLYDGKKVKSKDIEDFMCDEQVPDPNSGEVVYLLDANKD